jgi:hypothetical protein
VSPAGYSTMATRARVPAVRASAEGANGDRPLETGDSARGNITLWILCRPRDGTGPMVKSGDLVRQSGAGMLEAPWVIGSRLAEVTPGFVEAVEAVANSVGMVVTPAFEALSAHHGPASATVFNQATNDLLDLCFDILTGRGRSAMRTAHALYEHCVNAHEIAVSAESRRRYLDHQHVVGQIRARMLREADFLQGNDRRAFQHEIRKLERVSEREATAAVDRYGPGFRRSWSATNLHDMANQHGLHNGYDFYRVASSTLHGSAGGSVGTLGSATMASASTELDPHCHSVPPPFSTA